MSTDTVKKPISPDPALVAEIDGLIEKIKAIHERHGRGIASKFKRARKGGSDLLALSALGIDVPEDLRALYWHWNGVAGTGRTTHWDEEVFLNYKWPLAAFLTDWLRIARLEGQAHSDVGLHIFSSWTSTPLMLYFPQASKNVSPLVATEPWAQRVYHAFDGIVPMLRSVIAAEEAGVISYAPERVVGENGKIIVEANEIQYDPAALWEAIEPLNPRTAGQEFNYWRALATDTLEFDGAPPDIASGIIEMKPEVQEIVFREVIGEETKWDDELQKKLRDE